jgi:ribose-phosphate pyrophosphokinase
VFIASHGLLTGNAKQKLQNSLIDQVWITNSIYHANLPSKIKTLNVAPVFAQALKKWV